MKQKNLIIGGVAAIVALVAIGGVALSAFAAENGTTNNSVRSHFGRQMNGQGMGQRGERGLLSQAELDAKKAAIDAAIKAGDYTAWVTAVGSDCPMLGKINEGNFSTFVQAYNLREQARLLMEGLGVTQGEGGFGMMGGRGRFAK